MPNFNNPNIYKNILGNTIVIFAIIVIILLVVTYLAFKKVETYKFLIVMNIITAIIIFILLTLNDHYKFGDFSKQDITGDHKVDEEKLKYFNNILGTYGNPSSSTTGNLTSISGTGMNNIGGGNTIVDDVDMEIESLIKELKV